MVTEREAIMELLKFTNEQIGNLANHTKELAKLTNRLRAIVEAQESRIQDLEQRVRKLEDPNE